MALWNTNTTGVGYPIQNGSLINGSYLPNLDSKYGPYGSIEAANADISKRYRVAGLTIGIKLENNKIKEYWYQPQTITEADGTTSTSLQLVAKIPDSDINLDEVKTSTYEDDLTI